MRRIIGVIMLAVAVIFAVYAVNHPEASLPLSNAFTYLVYGMFIGTAFVLIFSKRQ